MNDQSQNLVSAANGSHTILFDLPLYATFMLPDICKDILAPPLTQSFNPPKTPRGMRGVFVIRIIF